MHKNKGIIIELTALLDVILIMLFWIMMNTRNGMNSAVTEAEKKAESAQQQLQSVQQQLDSLREETDEEIERIWGIAESIDKNAAADHQALMGFENGRLMTLNIKYDSNGMLYIHNGSGQLAKAEISSEDDVYNEIAAVLEQAKFNTEDIILCALVYDSKASLYKDVNNVKKAIDRVRKVYRYFYCAYINTSE
ncbi:MAG: hypothetical protein PUB97_07020 [Ruminococcus sp.]|nr:hypothetical protein [Ruminococcus sp.]